MEVVKVFNEHFQQVGEDTRTNVHLTGSWHETFHCWLIDEESIYVQRRSATKQDFPCLFDITAAGHLEADETVEDGVREIEEELGISVKFANLSPIGVVKDVIILPHFYDYEFAHVYLYESTFSREDFSLQEEEVDSIHTIKKQDFIDLCFGKVDGIPCFHLADKTVHKISLADFVPHQPTYFKAIAKALSLAENEKI